jgi:hypothetical protein
MTANHGSHDESAYRGLEDFPDATLQPERVLFLHVIAQAFIDAASKDRLIRREVRDWVGSEDFEIVCGMAGMQESWVRHEINAILRIRRHKESFKRAMTFRFLVRSFVDKHTGTVDKRKGLED